MWQGQRHDDPPPEVPHREQPECERSDDGHPDSEDHLDGGRQSAAEAPVAGREAEDRDREQVQDALDEDGPEGPRQRRGAVDLQEVGSVDVPELGRGDAVDQPREEDDLGGVLRPDAHPRAAQEDRPALAAQREAEVEHGEGQQNEQRICSEHETGHDLEQLAVEREEDGDDANGDRDRDERSRLTHAPREGHLLGIRLALEIGGDRGVGRQIGRVGSGRAWNRGAGVEGWGQLHVPGRYGATGPVFHRSMVLLIPVRVARSRHSGAPGLIRRLPRSRFTDLATGVHRRTA